MLRLITWVIYLFRPGRSFCCGNKYFDYFFYNVARLFVYFTSFDAFNYFDWFMILVLFEFISFTKDVFGFVITVFFLMLEQSSSIKFYTVARLTSRAPLNMVCELV